MTEDESLLAAIHEEVALLPYDHAWAVAFIDERDRLLSLFPGRFIGIEHIGSTAVSGLLSKPVIDILAGVRSMAEAEALVELLCRAGYTTSAEFNQRCRTVVGSCDGRKGTVLTISTSPFTATISGCSCYGFGTPYVLTRRSLHNTVT